MRRGTLHLGHLLSFLSIDGVKHRKGDYALYLQICCGESATSAAL